MVNINESNEPILTTDRENIHLNGHITSDALDIVQKLHYLTNENDPNQRFALGQRILTQFPIKISPAIYNEWFIDIVNQIENNLVTLITWMADRLFLNGKKQHAVQHLKSYLSILGDDELVNEKIEELGVRPND